MTEDDAREALLLELRSAYPDVEWRPLMGAKDQIGAASFIVHGCEVRVYRYRARPDRGTHTVLVYAMDPHSEDRWLLGSSSVGATAKTAVQNGLMAASNAAQQRLREVKDRAVLAARTAAHCTELLATFKVIDQGAKGKEIGDNG